MSKRKAAPTYHTDDVIMVVWVDQNTHGETVAAKGSINRCIGFTIGFYLEEDDEWMSVSCEKMHIPTEANYRHVITFPRRV